MNNVQLVFEDLGAIPAGDLATVTLALEDIGKQPYGAITAMANVLMDTVIVPELDRRCDGGEARTRIVELQNVSLTFREVRLAMHFAIQSRDHLLKAGKPEAAGIFDAVANGFGGEFIRLGNAAKQEAIGAAIDTAELERMFRLEEPHGTN